MSPNRPRRQTLGTAAAAILLGLFPLLSGCGSSSPIRAAAAHPLVAEPADLTPAPAPTKRLLRKVGGYQDGSWAPSTHFAVSGGRAYVADEGGGVHIVDVGNPRAPQKLGTVLEDLFFQEIVADGNLLFGRQGRDADGEKLTIVDTTDPNQPRILGGMMLQDVREMVLDGGFLYYDTVTERAGGAGQLVIVDVRNPAAPVRVATYVPANTDDWIFGLQVDRGLAYFMEFNPRAGTLWLEAVDVTDPRAPLRMGSYAVQSGDKLQVSHGVALVAGYGVDMVDVRDPGNMRHVATYGESMRVAKLAASNGYAVVEEDTGRTVALDFTDGRTLVPIESIWPGDNPGSSILALRASEGRAYGLVTNGMTPGVTQLEIAEVQVVAGCPDSGGRPSAAAGASREPTDNTLTAAAPPAHLDLTPLGQWGGAGSPVVALVEGVVYEGEGLKLVTRAIHSDAPPTDLGRIEIDGTLTGVAVANGVAWVTTTAGTLWSLDVHDPRQPQVLGKIPGLTWPNRVVVAEGLVYLLEDGAMSIVDAAEPARPVRLGQLTSSEWFARIAVADQWVFALKRWLPGVAIVNVADPNRPHQVGTLAGGQEISHLATSAGKLYLALVDSPTLLVMDIQDPTAPTQLATIDVGDDGTVSALTASNGLLHVAVNQGDTQLMSTFSVRNPRSPTMVAQLSVIEDVGAIGDIVAVESQLLLVIWDDQTAWTNGRDRYLIDISDASTPRRMATWKAPGSVDGVAVSNSLALVATGEGVKALDVADPAAPRQLGASDVPSYQDDARSLMIDGTLAYHITDWHLSVLDIADPRVIREVGTLRGPLTERFQLGDDVSVQAMAGGQRRLYALVREVGLVVVDVTDPTYPSPLGRMELSNAQRVAQSGDQVAVLDVTEAGWRLLVIDVTDPCAPQALGQLDMDPFVPLDLTVAGNTAYVWGQAEGGGDALEIIDLSNPRSPRLTTTLPLQVTDATVADGLLWLLSGSLVTALDVSDPTRSRVVARRAVAGSPLSIAVVGATAYVAAGSGGLETFRLTPGEAPPPLYLPAVARP